MTDSPDLEAVLLRRLGEADAAEPDEALAVYAEISDALIHALDGPDGSTSPP
jgi:hypothetical protein